MKKLLCVLMVVCMLFSFAACTNDNDTATQENKDTQSQQSTSSYPFVFTDNSGVEITIEKSPEKIASGAPATTEIIYAIGQQDRLVGVTEYCNYPEEAKDKEKIGEYDGVNVEKLIDLGVDLFITDYVADDVKKTLNDAGVTVAIVSANDYKAVYNNIILIGDMLDSKVSAKELVLSMQGRTDEILAKIKDRESVKVFHEVWHDPLMSSGPGSFVDEMINMIGGTNIAGDAESIYPQFSNELLIERNPQVYITADDGFKTVDDIKARTGYSEIDAIKNDRIYFLNPDVISIPGPRIVDALELIAKAIYPEVFK